MQKLKKILGSAFFLLFIITDKVLANSCTSGGCIFINFLGKPWVQAILVILGVVLIIIEAFTPGGIAGIFSAFFFILFFYGSIGANGESVLSLILFIIGILLIGIEIVIPGFGLPGIFGIIFSVLGLTMAFENITMAVITIAASLAISVALIVTFVKSGAESKFFKKIILSSTMDKEEGFLGRENENLDIGDFGLTKTPLKPSGYAIFKDKRVGVLAEGSFIDTNKEVVVSKIHGADIYVKER